MKILISKIISGIWYVQILLTRTNNVSMIIVEPPAPPGSVDGIYTCSSDYDMSIEPGAKFSDKPRVLVITHSRLLALNQHIVMYNLVVIDCDT